MLYKDIYIAIFKQKKYLKFLVSGFLAAMTNLLALYIFHGILHFPIFIAACLSFVIAYLVSFTLQKFWTFSETSSEKLYRQMIKYFLVGVFGMLLNAGAMHVLVEIFLVWYILAQIIMSACIAVMNYFLYKIIFRVNVPVETRLIASLPPIKRILIATGIYPPDLGGPASYSKTLKEELPHRGLEIKIVCYGETEESDKGKGIFRISRKQNVVLRYFKFFIAVWRQAKWADIIYAQGPVSEGLPTYLACRLRHKKYILKVVGDFAWEQGQQRSAVEDLLDEFQNKNYSIRVELWRLIEIFVAHGAEKVIVPSNYLKKIVMNWGINEDEVEVIYNSVDPVQLEGNKEDFRKLNGFNSRTIISSSRLVPWKGFDVLIEAVCELGDKYRDVKLYIVGAGPDEEYLKKKVSDMGQDHRIIFLGGLPQKKLWEFIKASDLFVLNTGYEGLSHLLIEVMNLEIPIVTTSVGGNPELIENNVSGLLVEYNHKPDLISSIKNILDNPNQSKVFTDNAKKTVEKFSRVKMIDAIIKLINTKS